MTKAAAIFRIGFKEMLAYRVNVFGGMLIASLQIVLSITLWGAIYSGDSANFPYPLGTMLSYFFLMYVFNCLEQSFGMVWGFAGEIRNGQFNKYLVRPVNPLCYFVTRCLAKSAYAALPCAAIALLWWLVLRSWLAPPLWSPSLLAGLVVFALGFLFHIMFNYLLALLAFIFSEVSSFLHLSGVLMLYLSGAMFPLDLFPQTVANILRCLPFYYTAYYPAAACLGMNNDNAAIAVAVIAFWDGVLLLVSVRFYKYAVRKYEGVGI